MRTESFFENLARVSDLQGVLAKMSASKGFADVERLLDYVESDAVLYDADRLAFRELLVAPQTEIGRAGSFPAVQLHKRIGEDLDALAEIEKNYKREILQIFRLPGAVMLRSSTPAAAVSARLVSDLQGKERKLVPQPTVGLSIRQQAQRANDYSLLRYREMRYAEAETAFTEALKLCPDFALATNNLDYVIYKQEKYREAARCFENTLKVEPVLLT